MNLAAVNAFYEARPFPGYAPGDDATLADAIESGLVKIPQLAVRDTTGAEIPGYFNIWRWIIPKLTPAERGGTRASPKPEAILKYAHTPIAMLAGLWEELRREWEQAKDDPRPPVFIVVCRDTRLARVVYEWLTGEGQGAAAPVEEFRNTPGREYTVRVDSRVVEDLASGVAKTDESRRLRFVLDTVGRTAWPGGRPPAEYVELVEKLNRKALEEGAPAIDPATNGVRVKW